MLLGKEDNIAGHASSRIWEVAETHINAYQYDDLDRLMSTVSPRGGIWAGLLPSQGPVIMRTTEQIREAYRHALAAVRIGPCRSYVAVASDWYVLLEGLATVTEKTSGQSIDLTGLGFYGTDGVGLAMDTDVGSILAADRESGPSAGPQRLADFDAHQRRLEAAASGDVDGALAGVGEQLDLFLPCFEPDDQALQVHVGDREAYRGYLERFTSRYRVEASRPANRLTTDGWVFSEVEWSLADQRAGGTIAVRYAHCDVLAPDRTVRGGIGVAVRA
jgi:hypothetical protein